MADEDPSVLLRELRHDITLIRNDQARIEESLTKLRLELGLAIRLLDLVAKQWAHLRKEEK